MTAPTFELVKEFSDKTTPDYISASPFWVLAVVRWAQPLTFSRSKLLSHEADVQFDADVESLIRERPVLVVSDDVLSMSISNSKGSPTPTMSVTFAGGDINYLSEIQANDWVMAWIVNDESKGKDLFDRILKLEACNKFTDGLKFIGRVQSIVQDINQSDDGKRTVRYDLTATGNKEFNSKVYYDPALKVEEPSIGQFLLELNIQLKDILQVSAVGGGISGVLAIQRILEVLLGRGIPPLHAAKGGVQIVTGPTSTETAPYAYVMPKSVLRLTGRRAAAKPVPSVADLMELNLGVQRYSGGQTPEEIFSPQGALGSPTSYRLLNNDMLSTFMPLPISFDNKTVWSLINEFLNPAVNEMYTTLRLNADGDVVPTLIVRPLPLSTPYMTQNASPVIRSRITGFLELPRWVAHPVLIQNLKTGKSDSARLNFVHIYGDAAAGNVMDNTMGPVRYHPKRDEQDIKRSGLSIYMQTVSASIQSTIEEPGMWMEIATDFLMGQQFTLTGSCLLKYGTSLPICVGDNFETDDVVYHIESVTHICGLMGDRKHFETRLTLSNGLRTDTPTQKTTSETRRRTNSTVSVDGKTRMVTQSGDYLTLNPELELYSCVKPEDNIGYAPPQTVDSRYPSSLSQTETIILGDFNAPDGGSSWS